MSKTQTQRADPLSPIADLIARFEDLQKRCSEFAQRRVDLTEQAKAVNTRKPELDRQKSDLLEQQQQALQVGDRAALDGTMDELKNIESEHSKNRARLAEIEAEQSRIAAEARNVLMPDFEVLSAESKEVEERIAAMLRDLVHVRRTTLDRLAAATRN